MTLRDTLSAWDHSSCCDGWGEYQQCEENTNRYEKTLAALSAVLDVLDDYDAIPDGNTQGQMIVQGFAIGASMRLRAVIEDKLELNQTTEQ